MKKCNFLNPDRYEFLIWFFLGSAITIIAWLIFFVVPIPKENIDIFKDVIGAAATFIVAIPSVVFVICQMRQQEEVQKQTNTLQLIDSLLYERFQKIFDEIQLAEEENARKITELNSQNTTVEQFDNADTEDAEPNELYFTHESKRCQIDSETHQKITKLINKFLDFIYDIEIKIEHNLVNEEFIKLYFYEPIQNILLKKFIISVLKIGSGYEITDSYSPEKKNKIKTLSKRWFEQDFFELDEMRTR